jgi:arsenate reductase (thioredoxin)
MSENRIIVFVCEHGAAKSIIAATYWNKYAQQQGVRIQGLARGTYPDIALSGYAAAGLLEDGLIPNQLTPQKLLPEEVSAAERVIAFCDLREVDSKKTNIEYWENVPAVSEDYGKARDIIVANLQAMMKDLA